MSRESDFEIAQQRIADWQPGKVLDLSYLWDLVRLPESISKLTSLQHLDCRETAVSDLSPLCNLTSLEQIDCGSTPVSDLSPLCNLTSLEQIDCGSTPVSDLSPLCNLTSLRQLYCGGTPVSDLSPLCNLTSLRQLHCGGTPVSDLSPLHTLTSLQQLDCSSTPVSDLSPLSTLTSLQQLACCSTSVSDLSPLHTLTSLQQLDCSNTPVSDLSPLSTLTSLQQLACRSTSVSDLSPLSSLTSLQQLDCRCTSISDLSPLRYLTSLQQLDCSVTKVNDLSPLSNLTSLQQLACRSTSVSDLSALCNLTSLQQLDCSENKISSLNPLSNLTSLQQLDCGSTQISDLSPLCNLTSLQKLHCSFTKIGDLSPLRNLTSLQQLVCLSCTLLVLPSELVLAKNLTDLRLHRTSISGIPQEVLSQSPFANCLDSLRAHFRDLGKTAVQQQDAKLMIIGNGRVGKTQICRRLRGDDFEPNADSTHGILISSAPVPGLDQARFHIWDFGGQDIYHGTHALFMRSRAVFLLAWSDDMERQQSHQYGGMIFRNYPLMYWLQYVRQFGGDNSALIIVQTHCDKPGSEKPLPSDVNEALQHFAFWKVLQFSASTHRGRAALDEALCDAYQRIEQPLIGPGRLKVMRKLEHMLDEDAQRPSSQRLHRSISYNTFLQLCQDAGDISDPYQLLQFLHHSGVVFYRSGFFNNQIILDQSWALDAIYAVFNRDACYRVLLDKTGGRFDRDLLGTLLWNGMGFSEDEQQLFIDMMVSCGICFALDKKGINSKTEAPDYLAPDLLPESTPPDLADKWHTDIAAETVVFHYDLLPSILLRNFMSDIGGEAGIVGDYWRNGFFVPERSTQSRARVQQTMTGEWQGEIRIETQGKQAQDLLHSLCASLEAVEQRIGISARHRDDLRSTRNPKGFDAEFSRPAQSLDFQQEKPVNKEYYVSYAWNDDRSPQGMERENQVDQLFIEAAARNTHIHRDKSDMRFGDSITKFMDRIGKGDRVFIFLSDKYLKSEFCMYELNAIWRYARQDEDEFSDKVRVYTLDDADIWKIKGRLKYAAYWRDELKDLEDAIKESGIDCLGEKDMKRYRAMKRFADSAGDTLATIVDRVQPKTWDDFLKHGFDVDSSPPPSD